MNPWQRDVRKFQSLIGKHSVETYPPDGNTRDLRARLLAEECQETVDALYANDTLEVIDGLTDIIYIAFGTAESYRIDLEPHWVETHRANMSKFTGGVVTINEFGKVKKPDDWRPPEHGRVYAELEARPLEIALRNEERAFQAYRDAQEDRRRIQEQVLKGTVPATVRPSI